MNDKDKISDAESNLAQEEIKKTWAMPKMVPLSTSDTEGAKPNTPTETAFSGTS